MHWNNIFKKQRISALGVLALVVSTAVLLYSIVVHLERQHRLMVWTATENDVEVEIYVTKDPSGQPRLSGTFTPTRQQFYLYGKDLPVGGLNGLGRPTFLEVIKSDSIKLTGPLEANRPTHDIYVETLDISFPAYPPGPVTLTLPFERISGSGAASMEVALTYMACSEKTCLPPVIDKHILIEIPADFFED